MIEGFIGKMGSGKTLSMVRELVKYYKKGFTIYTNFYVSFPHETIDFDKIFKMAEEQTPLNNVVIALDEIHILLDSRSGMGNKQKTVTFWLNQTRKQGVKLLFTTQHMHQIDKRLRSGTDFFVFCDGLKYLKDGKEYFIVRNYLTDGEDNREEYFIGNPFFKFYDTNEVVKFMEKNSDEDTTPVFVTGDEDSEEFELPSFPEGAIEDEA